MRFAPLRLFALLVAICLGTLVGRADPATAVGQPSAQAGQDREVAPGVADRRDAVGRGEVPSELDDPLDSIFVSTLPTPSVCAQSTLPSLTEAPVVCSPRPAIHGSRGPPVG